MLNKRLETIRNIITQHDLDAIFVSSPKHITYLSNFSALAETEREAFLLVTKNQQYIFTSRLYADEAKVSSPFFTLVEITPQAPIFAHVAEIFKEKHLKTLGIEDSNLTVAEFQKLQEKVKNLYPISLQTIRTYKDTEEMKKIAKACEIGDKVFAYICKEIHVGISEKHIAYLLENFMRQKGAEPSFPSIIAFGKNAAVPHHVTNNTLLAKNSFVLLDFGVKFNNYCSDMTRTVFVGTPSTEEKKMYETVRIAQEKAIEYIRMELRSNSVNQKIRASEADKTARNYITSQNYPSFPHGLGHGIGLEIHESPSLSPFSKDILAPGMVFSVEPGIYISGKVGIRIEDLAAITEKEVTELTHAPKNLISL